MPQSPSRAEITRKLAKARQLLNALQEDADSDNRFVKAIQDRQRRTQQAINAKNREIAHFSELLLVENGLPENVQALREAIFRAGKKATRTDITVAKVAEVNLERVRLQEELRGVCPHTFLLSYDERHSYTDEADWPEERLCVVCGIQDKSKTLGKTTYETLADSPQRMVKRDLREAKRIFFTRNETLFQEPLQYYLDAFRRSAGLLNAVWSDEEIGHLNPPVTARR